MRISKRLILKKSISPNYLILLTRLLTHSIITSNCLLNISSSHLHKEADDTARPLTREDIRDRVVTAEKKLRCDQTAVWTAVDWDCISVFTTSEHVMQSKKIKEESMGKIWALHGQALTNKQKWTKNEQNEQKITK